MAVINNFETYIKDKYIEHFLSIFTQVNTTEPNWWLVDKPLPEPVLTKLHDAIWCH